MRERARVAVVEGDPAVRSAVVDHLRRSHYDVESFEDGSAAWRAMRDHLPALVIVDRTLAGLSGDELSRRVREVSTVPIIMVASLGGVEHRIRGLECGADDYLTKPFSLRELQLRVAAQLRRPAPASAPLTLRLGPFRVDLAQRRLWVDDREIALTAREYELMLYLMRHPDRVVTRGEIMREVWHSAFSASSTVTVHVRRLRAKIEPDPQVPLYLRTDWGNGYRLWTAAAI